MTSKAKKDAKELGISTKTARKYAKRIERSANRKKKNRRALGSCTSSFALGLRHKK